VLTTIRLESVTPKVHTRNAGNAGMGMEGGGAPETPRVLYKCGGAKLPGTPT